MEMEVLSIPFSGARDHPNALGPGVGADFQSLSRVLACGPAE